eukprot:3257228-Prymnesium_polylepis.2
MHKTLRSGELSVPRAHHQGWICEARACRDLRCQSYRHPDRASSNVKRCMPIQSAAALTLSRSESQSMKYEPPDGLRRSLILKHSCCRTSNLSSARQRGGNLCNGGGRK